MKKFKFFAIIAAFFFAAVALSACGNNKDKDDDYDDDDKGKKGKADTTVVESERKVAHAPATVELGDDFESNMSYLEDNAPAFFPGLERVMNTARASMNGTEPSADEKEEMLEFTNNYQQYFEAFGVVLGYTMMDNLTPEQSARLDAYAEQYPQGMEDMQLLLQIGLAATGMQ